MNCDNFENEFDQGIKLSADAGVHLKACADCREHARLLELLSTLERVDVPKDFDFQLNARIARGKPGRSFTEFFPSMSFVAPVVVIVFVISIVGLSGLYFANKAITEPVAVTEVTIPIESNKINNDLPDTDEAVVENQKLVNDLATGAPIEDETDAPRITKNERNDRIRFPETATNPEKDPGGGSRDLAGTSRPTIIQPEFDSNRKIEGSSNPQGATVTQIDEVWKLIGISVESMRVTSVEKNSVAERSGLRIGDVLVAIDGQKISSDQISGDQINVRSVSVKRNGVNQEISLVNR